MIAMILPYNANPGRMEFSEKTANPADEVFGRRTSCARDSRERATP
jgi:hypothetical protein